MATVNITYFRPEVIRGAAAVISIGDQSSENITSSGTSQASTNSATAGKEFVRVATSGGNVYLAFAASPTAVTGSGILLLSDTEQVFKLPAGFKVAVIN